MHTVNETQQEFLQRAVERAKSEITADVVSGLVPGSVSCFAQLHDHVDANCYAGCCEESSEDGVLGLDLWNMIFPGADSRQEALGSAATLDAVNEMQCRLDAWLQAGGHRVPSCTG